MPIHDMGEFRKTALRVNTWKSLSQNIVTPARMFPKSVHDMCFSWKLQKSFVHVDLSAKQLNILFTGLETTRVGLEIVNV